jgi:hypothetical protein
MTIIALMPKNLSFIVVLICFCLPANAQSIRYTRQIQPLPDHEKLQLITDVAGNHHLLFFTNNAPVTLFCYDNELQFLSKKELPFLSRDSCDTRIIPFKNFYLLYFHKRGSKSHELWKVNADGDAFSLTALFKNFVEATFKEKTSTLQLLNQEEKLVLITHTYYDELKVLASSVIKVDESFKTLSSYSITHPFNREADQLTQVLLMGQSLFMLESSGTDQDYALQLIKADLTTGKLFRKTFNSRQNFTRDATFRYIAGEPGILIHSKVGSQVFFCKLDTSLMETVPATLVKPRYGNNVAYNFLLLGGKVQQWLAMNLPVTHYTNVSGSRRSSSMPATTNEMTVGSSYNPNDRGATSLIDYQVDQYRNSNTGFGSRVVDPGNMGNYQGVPADNTNPPICFSVLDKDLTLLKDSVVTNKKGPATLSATEYANLWIGNQSYLILKQEFSPRVKGLLLVTVDSSHQITTKDISVIGKYQYLLKDARTTRKEALVMPYLLKSEVGLVQLSFVNTEK